MLWKPSSEKPTTRKPILMKGDSGYIEPNHIFYVSGYYDPEYRPLSPWLDSQGSCVEDCGLNPSHWIYIDELEVTIKFAALHKT